MLLSFTILTILTLNLFAIFSKKQSRLNIVILVNIANLVTIFLFITSINSLILSKELTIVFILYSITISFLIICNKKKLTLIKKYNIKTLSIYALIILLALPFFYIAKTINNNSLINKNKIINNQIIKSKAAQQKPSIQKFNYIENKNIKNNIIFTRFSEFIIIICSIITILFLGIKHQKK